MQRPKPPIKPGNSNKLLGLAIAFLVGAVGVVGIGFPLMALQKGPVSRPTVKPGQGGQANPNHASSMWKNLNEASKHSD